MQPFGRPLALATPNSNHSPPTMTDKEERLLEEEGSDNDSVSSNDEEDGKGADVDQAISDDGSAVHKKKKEKKSKVFGEKWLAEAGNFNEKLKKRGVVYVARIPPRMTPTKLKSLLSEFGEVCRVYLVEEDKTARQRRKKQGGSGSKRYTEGWVEFAKKKVAKHVAQSLNNTQISNYKRSHHYGDLWNLKYLHKFKWSHLTEKVAYERRVREQKLRVEMMQARRENAAYVELVETGKKLDKIEARKRRREGKEGIPESANKDKLSLEDKKKRRRRQNKPLADKSDGAAKKAILRSLVQS